jgi:hypothetical protein
MPVAEKLVALTKRAEGEDSASTAAELSNLANVYDNLGQFDKVEPLRKEALAIRRKILGPEHPDTAESLYSDFGHLTRHMYRRWSSLSFLFYMTFIV